MRANLAHLVEYLESLTGRAPLGELTALLRRLNIQHEDVADFIHFSDRDYQRNLIRSGEWYHLWVLCWKNGQRSPIHDHKGSSCGVRVLHGTATVTQFGLGPNGLVKALGSEDFAPGA